MAEQPNDDPGEVEDWSRLVPGTVYALRSGEDTQQAVFLSLVTDSSALFTLVGESDPETFSQDDWAVSARVDNHREGER
ncbi:hypothetical protein [Leifsonia sp. Le1]|uniref:hypothetical protein n=1 Tax=Leifsonia sp. Le1 TaxID=3404918 RepID=UPI003EB7D98F